MDKNCQGNFTEIWAYMKNGTNLEHSAKSIYNEIVNIYEDNIVSYRTVSRWAKQFHDGRDRL